MKVRAPAFPSVAATALVVVSAAIFSTTAAAQGGYTITVNRDRLINALNEPQNWLLMNGDYGSLALLEAHADQPREREGPADGVGDGAGRDAGRRAERSRERS